MAFPRAAAQQDAPAAAIVDRLQVVGSIDAIRQLIQQLSAGWDDLNERQKIRLMKEIERRSGELVRKASLELDPRDPSIARANGNKGNAEGDVFLSRLTWREMQTLGALIDGGSTSQIAANFGIGETTVRSHVKSILAKLGVHSRIEAVAVAQSRISRRRVAKRLS
jgi:ATP/maltotriose-dependent transcriptional regulator MalT